MELQNEVLTTKTSIINNSTMYNKRPSLEQQLKVNRTRKILLIFICILLVLSFINFIFVLYSYAIKDSFEDQTPSTSSQLVSILISFVYYGFGLLVTYRYYQTGLLVYAWLGFISLLLVLVIAIAVLIGIIIATSHLGLVSGVIVAIIFIIICLTASLLQIFTVRYAFVLSNLLKNTKRFTIEQI